MDGSAWTDSAATFLAAPNQVALECWAGILFCMIIGKVTGQESRLAMWAVAAAILAPNPASFFFVGLLGLCFKLLDIIPGSKGG
jgi:hypothetical protein